MIQGIESRTTTSPDRLKWTLRIDSWKSIFRIPTQWFWGFHVNLQQDDLSDILSPIEPAAVCLCFQQMAAQAR